MIRLLLSILLTSSLLLRCASPDESEPPQQASPAEAIEELVEPAVVEPDPRVVEQARQRLIADTLFEGLQALDDNRLLTPVDDSAHARFARVLAYEPDNAIALQGMEDIVQRYLQLARENMGKGLFNEAEEMLERARFVNPEHASIEAVNTQLQAGMSADDMFYPLDYRELANRSELAQQELAEIALAAREQGAFFLITAPNDELARWMFSVMRQAVEGYRLRGNIELTSRTSVRLRMPGD